MDIVEAIQKRRSIRAFKPDPVPQQILKEIMELALRAPSWANTQPWEFAIVTGEKLEEIRRGFVAKADQQGNPDIPRPLMFPEPFDSRRRSLGEKVLEIMKVDREDRQARKWWFIQGLRLFEAPCVVYIYIDSSFYFQDNRLNVWPLFDCGLVAENIMLLATARGLGTIPQIQAVEYPDVLRQVLGIPASKLFVLGIAIGYPNWDSPINQLRSDREPVDRVVTWYGFEK